MPFRSDRTSGVMSLEKYARISARKAFCWGV